MSNTLFNLVGIESTAMTEGELLDEVEAWRKKHGLNKTELCAIAGIKNSQTYGNWLRRRSIPKAHISGLMDIARSRSPESALKTVRLWSNSRKNSPNPARRDDLAADLLSKITPERLNRTDTEQMRDRMVSMLRRFSPDEIIETLSLLIARIDMTPDQRDKISRALYQHSDNDPPQDQT